MCCGLLKLKTFHCVGKRDFGWEGELQVFLFFMRERNFCNEGCTALVYIHLTWRNYYSFICYIFQMKTQPFAPFVVS